MKFKRVNENYFSDNRRVFLESLNLTKESIDSIIEAEDSPETLHTLTSWEDLFGEDN